MTDGEDKKRVVNTTHFFLEFKYVYIKLVLIARVVHHLNSILRKENTIKLIIRDERI